MEKSTNLNGGRNLEIIFLINKGSGKLMSIAETIGTILGLRLPWLFLILPQAAYEGHSWNHFRSKLTFFWITPFLIAQWYWILFRYLKNLRSGNTRRVNRSNYIEVGGHDTDSCCISIQTGDSVEKHLRA